MRSIAEQSEHELGGGASLLVRQRRDHAELDVLLRRVAATRDGEQEEALRALYRLVFPHAFAEESVVWPVVRRALPDGQELTVRNEREHQEINELVTRLERTTAGDPERDRLVAQVSDLLRQDARDEEDLILPRLQAALDPAALRRLGRAWELVRRTAPTRAHPAVARRPPGNALAAVPLTLLDRSRARLEGRAGSRPGPLPALVRRASRTLAAVAGRVEHVPPFTRGEDPSTRSGRTG